MSRIYLEYSGKSHSLYNTLIQTPPEGYQVTTKADKGSSISRSLARNEVLYSFQEVILNKLVPVTILKSKMELYRKTPPNTDLTYSAGHLIMRDEPWVVDLEFYTQLAGYSTTHLRNYKKIIEKTLTSEKCKKIICWTKLGKETITNNTFSTNIHDKIELVRLSIQPKKFTKESPDDKTRLLFVGSSNIPGEFVFKGGIDLLRAMKILNKKYDNIELIIRSDVPSTIKKEINKIKNVKLLDQVLSWTQLDKLFKQSDIFLFPTHSTPGVVFLDAMSYELPIVTSDVWANKEMVSNNDNGFLIRPNKNVTYVNDSNVPIWNHRLHSKFIQSTQRIDKKRIKEIVDKTGIIIEDEKLRRKMGKRGREMVEKGEFSIKRRNIKLKQIFDEATS